jgi:hypothetical protein
MLEIIIICTGVVNIVLVIIYLGGRFCDVTTILEKKPGLSTITTTTTTTIILLLILILLLDQQES